MTKEITKAIILQQIQDKFKLRDFEPAKFLFGETVIPVFNIEHEIQTWEIKNVEKSITSGPTAFAFFTVPENERWVLRGYNVVFMAAGAYTVTGLYVWRGSSGQNIYLDMLLGQSVSYAMNLPQPVVLEHGNALYIYIDSYTSTAGLRLYIDYMKEEIR